MLLVHRSGSGFVWYHKACYVLVDLELGAGYVGLGQATTWHFPRACTVLLDLRLTLDVIVPVNGRLWSHLRRCGPS